MKGFCIVDLSNILKDNSVRPCNEIASELEQLEASSIAWTDEFDDMSLYHMISSVSKLLTTCTHLIKKIFAQATDAPTGHASTA